MPLRRLALLFSLFLVLFLASGYLLLRNIVVMPYVKQEALMAQRQELRNLQYQFQNWQRGLTLVVRELARNDRLVALLKDKSLQVEPNSLFHSMVGRSPGLYLYDDTLALRFQRTREQRQFPLLSGEEPFRRARLMPLLASQGPRWRSGVLAQGGINYLFAAATACNQQASDCGYGYLVILRELGSNLESFLQQNSGMAIKLRSATLADAELPQLVEPASITKPKARRELVVRDDFGQPVLVLDVTHLSKPPGAISRYEWITFVALLVLLPLFNLLTGHLLVRPMERGVAEIRAMQRNQSFRPLRSSTTISEFHQLTEAFNGLMRMLAQQRDKLKQLSRTDTLTGLPNRRAMEQFLDQEWRRVSRNQRGLALMMVDIDHFKLFNDHFGHGTGDEVLVKVARVLDALTRRGGELACRWGGEEFVLALTEPEPEEIRKMVERLQKRIQGLDIAAPGVERHLTVSIGVALLVQGQDPMSMEMTVEDLLDEADKAMYRVKQSGRNNWSLWRSDEAA